MISSYRMLLHAILANIFFASHILLSLPREISYKICKTRKIFPILHLAACSNNNYVNLRFILDKVFKSGLSKFCGRQPLKNLKGYRLLKYTLS